MMNSMSGVRITGNNRLCHARAGIVTEEAMMGMGRIPRAAAIGRISAATGQMWCGNRGIRAGLWVPNGAPAPITTGPNRSQWEVSLNFST
jgi:hypothetical protein